MTLARSSFYFVFVFCPKMVWQAMMKMRGSKIIIIVSAAAAPLATALDKRREL